MLVALSINARIADTHVSTVMGSSCVPLVLGYRADITKLKEDDFEKKSSSRRRIRSLSRGQRQENNEMNQSMMNE